jgi:nucleoid DNA-binding protein
MATKTAAPKTAKPKAGTAKPVASAVSKPDAKPAAPVAAVDVVTETAKVALSLRVKDLIERVAAAGEFKKKDVRDIVEATLVELGRALEDGYSLNLPPFGKMHIRNSRAIDNGASAMTLKVRRGPTKPTAPNAEKEALAEVGEAG